MGPATSLTYVAGVPQVSNESPAPQNASLSRRADMPFGDPVQGFLWASLGPTCDMIQRTLAGKDIDKYTSDLLWDSRGSFEPVLADLQLSKDQHPAASQRSRSAESWEMTSV